MAAGSRARSKAHSRARSTARSKAVAILAALLAVALVVCLGVAWRLRSNGGSGADGAGLGGGSAELSRASAAPAPPDSHPGNSPDCPDLDCIALLVNGDMLFHARLWNNFAGANTAATDGTAYDFTELFVPMARYLKASDISVCNFETPVSKPGGPYADYPSFNIPPETAAAVAKIGYTACTHATNHSWDQGLAGIQRLNDTLNQVGLKQTGSYTDEADSMKPLVLDSPTGGGKLAVIAGTVSLNGNKPSEDWMVDRLRGKEDPHHQSDIDRAVAKAKAAREQGADLVTVAMHSVVEYIDYADDWQVSEAHALADTGAFDLIFGTGSHSAQPIEYYNGTWIIYGLGNAVTVSAPPERVVNNQGVTARIQFAGRKGVAGSWRVSRIDWLPTANMRQGLYRWCPIASDHPDGTCWTDDQDAQVHDRIRQVLYAKGADPNVVREWRITDEAAAQ
ncbi:CapA family protein [Bifidobacterium avesanii]|uniref:CapA family protein n=1 Tax=Bifidobacterium avesanii TaxID=1798157 RepID=A0A7K3THD2_9BIFI|nr:CapA family protein [Bifidobacterium avesanii]NEG78119.1 CapA family protein [Bifidobacterium avesanii]